MADQPIIGLLMDYQDSGDFSQRPHYALRCSYFDAVWKAGGLPVALPYLDNAIDALLAHCDGLILPGGFYPFPPSAYGEESTKLEPLHPRFSFEHKLAKIALEREVPTLGICAGMQVMAITMGATLFRDVRKELPTKIDHLNNKPAEQTSHKVYISPKTQLWESLKADTLEVNTAHKEALKNSPEGAIINARADDHVIEGIELPGHPFYLGVQWHPEFFAERENPNMNLFLALITAAKL